ncbi:MAG TPA: hypothetical protein VLM38_24190 [Blastocatellia bacterium]|nr:hypothetical protein [Blastocatellia bacterium]
MAYTHPWKEPETAGRFGTGAGVGLEVIDPSDWTEDHQIDCVRFIRPSHEELARALDEHHIPWRYKPRTFAVEWDDQGNFLDSFTPDFYLPALDLYVELADRESDAEKSRRIRLLRQTHPSVRVDLLTYTRYSDLTVFSHLIHQPSKVS